MGRIPLLATWMGLPLIAGSSQDPHSAMNQRGAAVMGFDQTRTTHHFLLYEDGGAIDVSANEASDHESRDAIRQHLPHIAVMFGKGNFEAPMLVHATEVPGTAELSKRKDRIEYRYVETASGGRIDMVTNDDTALKALHEFLRFQIRDHGTGDTMEPRKR
jgi:hypothetical protein